MKFTEEQMQQIRQAIRDVVGDEIRDAISTLPILTQEPKEAGVKGWIKQVLPRSIAGYACALFVAGSVFMAAVIYVDRAYHALEDGKPLVDLAVAKTREAGAYAQVRLWTPSFWHDPLAGKLPPIAPNPIVPVGYGITGGNSNSVSNAVVVNLASGTSSGTVTSNGSLYFRFDDNGNVI
jgi:hypothetical protein